AIEKVRDAKFAEPDRMSDEQLRDAGAALKKQAAGLSDQQKRDLWERSMPLFMPMMMKRAEQKMDQFLALSPEEQRREMDKKINERRSQGRSGPPRPGAGDGKPEISAAKADEFRKKMNDWTTPEQRAKFEAVMSMYEKRKRERGL
ncbi:MAG: hypothetical protein AAF961_12115, partial [Planctomycetota bacterium]